jgi:hypothetical protein
LKLVEAGLVTELEALGIVPSLVGAKLLDPRLDDFLPDIITCQGRGEAFVDPSLDSLFCLLVVTLHADHGGADRVSGNEARPDGRDPSPSDAILPKSLLLIVEAMAQCLPPGLDVLLVPPSARECEWARTRDTDLVLDHPPDRLEVLMVGEEGQRGPHPLAREEGA